MIVPGAGFLSSQECEEKLNKRNHIKKSKKLNNIIVPKTAIHNISLCKEAFYYMISSPFGKMTKKEWNTLNINQRLEKHLKPIAEDFKAISFSFQVLED